MSIRQERVPIRYRARVFGTLTTLAFIAIPLGQLAGGYVVEWVGVRGSFAISSSVLIMVVATMFFTPVLHQMDERPVARTSGAAPAVPGPHG